MYQIIMIGGIFAIMYFMVIRPQKKRQQELSLMRDNLTVGDKAVTIGGIVGEVSAVDGDEFHLLTAGQTKLVFKKTAVALVESKVAAQPELDSQTDVDEAAPLDDGIAEQETEIKE